MYFHFVVDVELRLLLMLMLMLTEGKFEFVLRCTCVKTLLQVRIDEARRVRGV